ncbi:hypothetical protein [uncultured Acinetobacter sp.]|uniref:hypothetical protein n=1 Tax=uncultured Acinetobacter sp. TaxID=165433 RepID=UPI00258DC248|nr:hypothetical protein [uncultured Acinetobacter sp.]
MFSLEDIESAYEDHFKKFNYYPTHIALSSTNFHKLNVEENEKESKVYSKLKKITPWINSEDLNLFHESELIQALEMYKVDSPYIGEIEVDRYASKTNQTIKIDTHVVEAYHRKLKMTF